MNPHVQKKSKNGDGLPGYNDVLFHYHLTLSFSANVQPSLTPPVVDATPWSGLLSLDFPFALVYSLERTKPGFRVFGVAGSLAVRIFSLFSRCAVIHTAANGG